MLAECQPSPGPTSVLSLMMQKWTSESGDVIATLKSATRDSPLQGIPTINGRVYSYLCTRGIRSPVQWLARSLSIQKFNDVEVSCHTCLVLIGPAAGVLRVMADRDKSLAELDASRGGGAPPGFLTSPPARLERCTDWSYTHFSECEIAHMRIRCLDSETHPRSHACTIR